jgi:hypothetical protein
MPVDKEKKCPAGEGAGHTHERNSQADFIHGAQNATSEIDATGGMTAASMQQPTLAEAFLEIAAVAYDALTPYTGVHLKLGIFVENILSAAHEKYGVPLADVTELRTCLIHVPFAAATLALAVAVLGEVSDESFQAAGLAAGVAAPKPMDPRFVEAGEALSRIRLREGEAGRRSPERSALIVQLWAHAPEWFVEEMAREAQSMGLLPKTTHVDADGNAVFSMEQLAEVHGVPLDELRQLAHDRLDPGALYRGPVYPLQ